MATRSPSKSPRLECASDLGSAIAVRLWSHAPGYFAGPTSAHPTIELAWIETGEVTYRTGSRELTVKAGQAFLVPRGVEHQTVFGSAVRAGALALSAEMVAEIADAIGGSARALEAGILCGSARIAALGALVRGEIMDGGQGHALATESLAEAMTIAMLRHAPGRDLGVRACDPRVVSALERINTSYADPLGVEELARAAGMSKFHFSRLFRSATGHSPYQYLLRTRVTRAAELLRSGRRSVTEAAFSVGFTDLGRFSRSFRALMGANPSAISRARITKSA